MKQQIFSDYEIRREWEGFKNLNLRSDLIIKQKHVTPGIVLATLVWILVGLPVSCVLVPVLGHVFLRKTCGWYLSLFVSLVLIPLLAPILFLSVIIYIVSFCGWLPSGRSKTNQIVVN